MFFTNEGSIKGLEAGIMASLIDITTLQRRSRRWSVSPIVLQNGHNAEMFMPYLIKIYPQFGFFGEGHTKRRIDH
ncbi:hypothetical protein AQUCO_01200024v1 [Aquilegia coerulea]|uniref:Uncharacterized protein n=1 Tax=Aquilegia coerulea TaxID=218851 RepID=A0A2G5E465_AQUCA|nr:hypothetical protein AQUCO_01200024v1 [Aquilegia coerulea]